MTAPGQTPLMYGPPISLDLARQILAGAEAEARVNRWPMAIAIVDTTGRLKVFASLDGTQNASVDIARKKAETANNFKRPTKVLEDMIAGGGAGLKMLSLSDACALEGGLPIVKDGAVIGGIGVSGMRSDQDAQVALAGLKAAGLSA